MSHSLCRFCQTPLTATFVDLGLSPLCQNIIRIEEANQAEPFYPLHVSVCDACKLVQLGEYVSPSDIFTEYAYFSSYSDSLVAHAKKYVETITARLGLTANDLAVEIASNDGYLLQHFLPLGIPVTGIEPAKNVGAVAREKGIPVVHEFMGVATATNFLRERGPASLLIGNNVLAHVPDINDFVEGMHILLAEQGTITMEFPHLLRLIEGNQFDTIYHEHFSYLSLLAVEKIFAAHGLTIFDVDELKIHGGSIRIYAQHTATNPQLTPALLKVRSDEAAAGFETMAAYSDFGERVKRTKNAILSKLIELKSQGKTIVGYGAPGKGNTLLNYCGIRTDYLDYTVDRNPYKQGTLLPGSRIPVHPVEKIAETKPDYIFILPWNLTKEITGQLAYVREWGGKFIVPIPEVSILE
ncbi:MAG TPA: class I SAM-dependent methyltransferase [Chthoniobacterales bacterium]|jgi:hypothetical protein